MIGLWLKGLKGRLQCATKDAMHHQAREDVAKSAE